MTNPAPPAVPANPIIHVGVWLFPFLFSRDMERRGPSLAFRHKERRLFLDMLRDMRFKKGLRQSDVARRLGRKQAFVSKYEMGERRLAFLDMVAVCDALDVSIVDFVKRFDKERRRSLP